MKILFFAIILVSTWVIDVYHRGVAPLPQLSSKDKGQGEPAVWIPKERIGINQLILQGTPYQMGRSAGEKTKELLYRQEKVLVSQYEGFVPNIIVRKIFEVLGIRYFWGVDKFIEPWMLEEMYGVSLSTDHSFDYLGTPLTRQVIYHGLHEVGQLAVDQGSENMGCTVVAFPYKKAWILGRNFDFEGGRIFDTEKIMKWVYPEKGFAYLSIIWAGMVGSVTGVNEKGVYISLNAAGTKDFARFGTPSTLVITKALMTARSAREAVAIIRDASMFITDLFVVADRDTGEIFRIEKSPKATDVISLHEGSAVTNHLISPRWANDAINRHRTFDQTSLARSERAESLIAKYKDQVAKSPNPQDIVARILRDKGEANGKPLHLGNRKAIDALIATHSVIYNAADNILFVSQGPGATGAYLGFNLTKSFLTKMPVVEGRIAQDPDATPAMFLEIRETSRQVERAQDLIHHKQCSQGKALLDSLKDQNHELYSYYLALGDFHKCMGQKELARLNWQRSLDLSPAYLSQVNYLKENLR